MRGHWKLLILLLCVQLAGSKVFAQVKYAFAQDTLGIKGGGTFSNLLKVVNPYGETVVLKQDKREKELYKGLIALPDSLVLKAGESRSFPVKYLADRQTITSNIQQFKVNLVAVNSNLAVQQSAAFMTQLADVGGITIGTEDDEVYLSQLTNQAQVVIRCANNGFVPVTFRLVLTGIPEGLEFTGETMNLTIQPGTQRLLPFLVRNKEGTRSSADFTVTIQAMDERNNQLAVKIVRVVRVTSARRLGGVTDQFGGMMANTVALRYGSVDKNSSFYQLQGYGKIKTGEDQQLEYRLSADQYNQTGEGAVKGINIYNTYLDYQAKSWGVKVGNIYDNIDFQMGGRGIKASGKLKNQGVVSVYGIQNNYLLYNQFNNTIPGAKVFALDYNLVDQTNGDRRITAFRSHDPVTGLDANQLSAKTIFKSKDGQTLGFEGGVSLEAKGSSTIPVKKGGAFGVNYAVDRKGYQIYGNSYYSSPYFTGLRRGLWLTDVRLSRKFDQYKTLTAHVSLQSNNARYQDSLNNVLNRSINKNSIYQYEIAYNLRKGHYSFGFGPYFMQQRLVSSNYMTITPGYVDWESSSFRFAANLGYSGTIHSFSINADYGYTYLNTSGKPPAPFHSVKINSSYTMPLLGFSSYIQFNPFYLSDALSSVGGGNYRLYSFGPNLHFTALKNALHAQFSGMYNYYGFTNSNNYSVTGNIRYEMKGHWAFTGDVLYTVTKQKTNTPFYDPALNTPGAPNNYVINDFQFNNRQIRIGIEKQFGTQNSNGSKKLQLTYYEDRNSNGQRDADEAAIPGVLVKINGEAALTNSKGYVEFRDMKKEAYTVSVTNTRGWSLLEPTSVFLDKNKKLEIPLVKTQALNGVVQLAATKYAAAIPVVLSGIRINAVDANGRIHQTLTDDQGKFCFYLPRNEYTVYIETKGMQFSIDNDKQKVFLQGEPVALLTFLYRDAARKVSVTRF